MNITDVRNIYETDIERMNKDQLISLLSEYISKTEYLNRRQYEITRKVKENNKKRSNKLVELDRRYQAFYSENLLHYENKVKEKNKRIKELKNKFSNILIKEGMIKFHYLFAFIYIPILLILTVGFLTYPDPKGKTGFFEAITYITLYLFGMTLVAYIPLKWIVRLLKYLTNPIVKIIGWLLSIVIVKIARYKDITSAKKKGITKENIEEIFKLDYMRQTINNDFDELEVKIRSWDKLKSIKTKNDISIINNIIPMSNKKLDYMYYIYEQLCIGANESWKECINDLKLQLRHNDITNEIRNISNNINKSNDLLINLNNSLQRNFSHMEDMIYSETNRINKRLDGFFETIYLDPYPLYWRY